MTAERIEANDGVTLVGAGQTSAFDIEEALTHAPTLVAADGGAAACLAAGYTPKVVVGDFDSLSDETRHALGSTPLIEIAEQETTDFEKCLSRIDAPFVIATGFTGGRLDHTLATFSTLSTRVGPPTLLVSPEDVTIASDHEITLDLVHGTRVSLFPLAATIGRSEGLHWPIDGLTLDPRGRIGTSNRAIGQVRLFFDAPGCLILVPRAALLPALNAIRPD